MDTLQDIRLNFLEGIVLSPAHISVENKRSTIRLVFIHKFVIETVFALE
jgi:hypothetical protein